MWSMTQEETLNAKAAYERFSNNHGINICWYHSNNGQYAKNNFQEAVANVGQKITYWGVGPQHQNGITEVRIKYLMLAACTMLLYSKRHWTEAIADIIWPYAMKSVGACHNHFYLNNYGLCPLKLFSGVESTFDLNIKHTWGCPAYILDAKIQDRSRGIPKWEPRSLLDIYLGNFPVHAGSIVMILNPKTEHVPPQYHIFLRRFYNRPLYESRGYTPKLVVPCQS